jgi:hypothetical protein
MKAALLMLALLGLTTCTVSQWQLWALNDPLSGPFLAREYRPLKVRTIVPSPNHLAAVQANQQAPRRPYAWDYSIEVW